jgi:tape measure domain-containing protein
MGFRVGDFFASLGLQVDTTQVERLEQSLSRVDTRIRKVTRSFNRMGEAIQRVVSLQGSLSASSSVESYNNLTAAINSANAAQTALNASRNIGAGIGAGNGPSSSYGGAGTGSSAGSPSNAGRNQRDIDRDRLRNMAAYSEVVRRARTREIPPEYLQRLRAIRDRVDGTVESYRRAVHQLRTLNRESQESIRTSARQARAFGTLRWNINAMSASLNNLARSYMGVFAAINVASKAFNTAKQFEKMDATLKLTSKSPKEAAETMKYIRDEANRLGLDMLQFGGSFNKFAAAVDPKLIDKAGIKEIFSGVAEGVTAFSLTAEESGFVYRALTQIASKGKVSMEEVRRQMAEQMPNALRLMASGMGVSIEKFEEMAKQGKLISMEVLPNFARAVHKDVIGVLDEMTNNMQANQNRMNNAFKDMADQLFKSGLNKAVTAFFQTMTILIKDNQGALKVLSAIFSAVGAVITAAIALILLPFKALSNILETLNLTTKQITKGLYFLATLGIMFFTGKIIILIKALSPLLFFFNKWFLLATLVLVVLDEITAFFDDSKLGLFESWFSDESLQVFADTLKKYAKLSGDWFMDGIVEGMKRLVGMDVSKFGKGNGPILSGGSGSNLSPVSSFSGGKWFTPTPTGPQATGSAITINGMTVIANDANEFTESVQKQVLNSSYTGG